MITMSAQPSLGQLYAFINKVPAYPLSIQRLIRFADQTGAPKEVLNFYSLFARDQIFDDKDDLVGRSEQIQIMRSEDMPMEKEVAPEEY